MTIVLFGAGLASLLGGAEFLVRGASRLAALWGVPPLLVGLTVVAFGTSAPEIAVSVAASRGGQPAIALGNVVGSNICNVLLILGLAAVISPLAVAWRLVRLEVPLMIGVSFAVFLLAGSGSIPRWVGAVLLAGGIGYTVFLVKQGRQQEGRMGLGGSPGASRMPKEATAPPRRPGWPAARAGEGGRANGHALLRATDDRRRRPPWLGQGILILLGLTLLVLGSRWLVTASVALARTIGVSELVIGLTIVSIGTSLPEIATCAVAGLRRQSDLAAGNVLGSNLFNLLFVLGLASLVAPGAIPVPDSLIGFDLPVMVGAALACLPVFFTGRVISRWEGMLFLAYYAAYLLYLLLYAQDHEALPLFSAAMLWFVVPLTALGLLVSVLRPRSGEPREAVVFDD